MSSAAKAEGGAEGSEEAKAPKAPLSIGLILALVNTLAAAGAAGMLVYTKLLFKRPAITEGTERARLKKIQEKKGPPPVPGLMPFDPITVNIAPSPARPGTKAPEGEEIHGKLHYATVSFTLEIGDMSKQALIEELRPKIMDRLLSIMGRKTFMELSSAQGRYLLRAQIVELTNELLTENEGLVPASHYKPAASAGGHSAPAAEAGGHGAPAAEGGGHGAPAPAEDHSSEDLGSGYGLIANGLVTNVFFSQFLVQ